MGDRLGIRSVVGSLLLPTRHGGRLTGQLRIPETGSVLDKSAETEHCHQVANILQHLLIWVRYRFRYRFPEKGTGGKIRINNHIF